MGESRRADPLPEPAALRPSCLQLRSKLRFSSCKLLGLALEIVHFGRAGKLPQAPDSFLSRESLLFKDAAGKPALDAALRYLWFKQRDRTTCYSSLGVSC